MAESDLRYKKTGEVYVDNLAFYSREEIKKIVSTISRIINSTTKQQS
jgi:hypothetical protein